MYPRFGTDDVDGRHRTNLGVWLEVWMGPILAATASVALLAAQAWAADPEALRRICASGTVEELRAALRTCSADEPFPDGNRPLHIAAEHASDPGLIKCLLDGGASLSPKGLEGLTPLMLAAAYNLNAAIVEAYQEDILALKKIWATEAIGLKEQADRLIAQAAGKGRNDAQLHAQMQLLDAEIRTYEEKIRQYQRASITTVIANEIDIKALIAEIQTLKDIMADLRQASVEDSQGGYERKSAAPWVLGIVAVLALGAAATGGYYYFAKVAGKKTPIPVEEDPPAVLTELPVIGQAVSNTGTSNTRPVVSSDVVPPTPVATTAEQQPQPETRTSDGSIMAREAGQYIGETRRVCGKVAALKETKKSIALHFDAPSPNQSFTAVVWKTSRALSRQASHLVHADICVTGKIEENRKKPQMIVSESAQISFND